MLQTQLTQLEALQLVRRAEDEELAYWFKHALTQEAVYQSLLYKSRQQLHRAVAQTYEALHVEHLDENAALLAYHFEQAQDRDKALDYLERAAAWAHRGAGFREEAALLARAIALVEESGDQARAAALHAQRGRAFIGLTQYANARSELESALACVPADRADVRAQALADLAIVSHWLLDVPNTRRYAAEALTLAEEAGRDDLAANAMGALALADSSDGLTKQGLKGFERAFKRAGGWNTPTLTSGREMYGVLAYWLGQFDRSIERSRDAARLALEMNDPATYMRSLGNLGLAYMASGRSTEALQTLADGRAYGRKHDLATWSARVIAIESGCHLDLFDFAGSERIAEEAREIARSSNYIGPVVSAGIDLLFNYARRREPGRAGRILPEVAAQVEQGKGSHGWLWRIRFAQVRAELALAEGKWAEAVSAAEEAITRARATGRAKYLVAGQAARGLALVKQGKRAQGLADLRAALKRADKLGEPAVYLRTAAAYLTVELDDALAARARAAAQRTAATLPTAALRDQFEAFVSELFP